MALTQDQAKSELLEMLPELDRRAHRFRRIDGYFTGDCPLPRAIVTAKVTNAYRMLMAFAQTNYGRLVIKAATSRMQVGGIQTGDRDVDDALWRIWQANHMDGESRRGHDVLLTHGRVFAVVWPRDGDIANGPQITLEQPDTVLVRYREGSRYDRVSAVRRWVDSANIPHATLYRPDALYKFSGPKNASGQSGTQWTPRAEAGEEWPLPNPFDVVNVVEIAANRELRNGEYGRARGDFEGSIGLLDRINVLEFLRLVIAFTAGFPIRVVIGDKILRDDDGEMIAPFKLAADLVAQLENPNAKIAELKAADIESFGKAIDHDVETLAGITQTPGYYLRSVPIQNVSADAIIASDAPLNARVEDRKPEVAEGWEETLRVAGLMLPEPVVLPDSASVHWVNREVSSLAARADASQKLKDIFPWQFIAEKVWQLDQDEVTRYEAMRLAEQAFAAPAAGAAPVPPAVPPPAGA